MKKVVCLAAIFCVFMTLLCPAFAEEGTFVPSISYKDGPKILEGEISDEDVTSCLVITSLKAAEEKSTDIHQDSRDLLLQVYKDLESGEQKLPIEDDYIIRELVDLSWKQTACIEVPHTHEEDLKKEGVTVTVNFELGVSAREELVVLIYHNNEWQEVGAVVNNGDGTATVEFEDICPVAFCVKTDKGNHPTGDIASETMLLWIVLMIVSTAAIVVMTVNRRKYMR